MLVLFFEFEFDCNVNCNCNSSSDIGSKRSFFSSYSFKKSRKKKEDIRDILTILAKIPVLRFREQGLGKRIAIEVLRSILCRRSGGWRKHICVENDI